MIDDSRFIAPSAGHPADIALMRSISENQNVIVITPDLHRGMEVNIDEFNPLEVEAVDIEHSNEQRILVVGSSNSAALRAAMVATLVSGSFSRSLNCISDAIPSIAHEWCWDWNDPPEWRWSGLHQKLSLQATLLKEKKVQQRRQALFKHHQEKRAKKGRSHAKQRAKSMKRFA